MIIIRFLEMFKCCSSRFEITKYPANNATSHPTGTCESFKIWWRIRRYRCWWWCNRCRNCCGRTNKRYNFLFGIGLQPSLLAGLKTALLEYNDFSSGTSSRSTKLIHGGVRYLQNAIFHLDKEQVKMEFSYKYTFFSIKWSKKHYLKDPILWQLLLIWLPLCLSCCLFTSTLNPAII